MSDFLNRWPINSGPSAITNSPQFHRRWADYYQAVAGRPPRETLLTALERFSAEPLPNVRRTAVDLGCGDGRDTVELLRQNWRVIAIDGESEAIIRLRRRSDINRTYLETRVQRFEELTLPPDLDLINASFCLPMCKPDCFSTLWEEIVVALRPGGRFCGHLFGDRDSWTIYGDINFHTRSQIEELLSYFNIELLDEEDHPGKTALGEEKHWHLYNIVASKR
ncbi:MAG: class I SAM-dependent methyltransferase [Leptolyngbyaceae cyanobacterium]